MMKRDECLKALASHLRDDDVVVPVFQAAFEWIVIRPNDLNYITVGAMGQASSHALGLALARPDLRVIVIDGDGATTVPGLCSAGENSGGSHGYNRLRGNARLEIIQKPQRDIEAGHTAQPVGGDGLADEDRVVADDQPERHECQCRRCWSTALIVSARRRLPFT